MFYETFLALCAERGVRPGRAADEMGINRGTVTSWKKAGYSPRAETLQKIADYFGVSVNHLLAVETETAPTLTEKGERQVTDKDIKFALFGDTEIDDDVLDEVKRFAQFAKEQRRQKEQTGD